MAPRLAPISDAERCLRQPDRYKVNARALYAPTESTHVTLLVLIGGDDNSPHTMHPIVAAVSSSLELDFDFDSTDVL